MPDREKVNRVNRAWECCNPFNRKCKECPYEKDCYHDGISRHMVADALALLKEQEAVEPRVSTVEQRCGNCNKVIEMDGWITCPWCGKPIKWEGR